MDEYYTKLMQECAKAIGRDGLDAKVEIDATDLMILVSKAVMQRFPLFIPVGQQEWIKPNIPWSPIYEIGSGITITEPGTATRIWYRDIVGVNTLGQFS